MTTWTQETAIVAWRGQNAVLTTTTTTTTATTGKLDLYLLAAKFFI
jgi:hypothetical protein